MKQPKLILMLLLFCTVGLFAQDMTSAEKDIKEVIENETKMYNARDYDGWAATWAHSPAIYWSVAGPEWSKEVKGWEALSMDTKKYFEKNPDPVKYLPKKTDYEFSVNGNMAFVTFHENGNMSTRVLAKKKGAWKLMRMGVVETVAYETQRRMDAMENLVGIWYLDPTSVEVSDESWTLNNLKCKVKSTDLGMKMYMSSNWKSDSGFEGEWKEEYIFANDSEAQKVGVMISTKGPKGTSVHSGKCYFKEDYMVVKAKKLGSEGDALMKQKIALKDGNTMKMHYVFLDDKGETEWEMKFKLTKSKDESLAMR